MRVTRLILNRRDIDRDEITMQRGLRRFFRDSRLRAIYLQGDSIDVEFYKFFKQYCTSRKMFLSILLFNNEAGSIVGMKDFDEFAEDFFRVQRFNLRVYDKIYFDLYQQFKKNTKIEWTVTKTNPEPQKNIIDHGSYYLTPSRSLHIARTQFDQTLVLKDPLYPTVFNAFCDPHQKRLYMHCFFNHK